MSESTFRCTECQAEKDTEFTWADVCNGVVDKKGLVCDCPRSLNYPVYRPAPPPKVDREPHPIEKIGLRIKDKTSWGQGQAGRKQQQKAKHRSEQHQKKYGKVDVLN